MKILITGHKGFIGSNLFQYLKEQEHDVYGYDKISDEMQDTTVFYRVNHFIGELKPQVIIHLASNISNNPHECCKDIEGTINMLEAAKKHSVEYFLFASSAAVYGNKKVYEEPINPYGISKLQQEQWVQYYQEHFKISIMRFANVYGKGGKGVINQWLYNIKNDMPIEISGDGLQTRDFIYVNDVCKVIHSMIENHYHSNAHTSSLGIKPIYNISTYQPASLLFITQLLHHITGKDITIKYTESKTEIRDSCLDNGALGSLKKCIRPIKEGITELWNEK